MTPSALLRSLSEKIAFIKHHYFPEAVTLVVLFGVVGVFMSLYASNRINLPIPYQGKLVDSNYVPVADGTYYLKFGIYDSATGGTCLWRTESAGGGIGCAGTPSSTPVTVNRGLFTVYLGNNGTNNPEITSSITNNFSSGVYYLGVTACGTTNSCDSEMTPRRQMGGVPYAYNSDFLDGISSAGFLQLSDSSGQTLAYSGATGSILTLSASSLTGGSGLVMNGPTGGTAGNTSPLLKITTDSRSGTGVINSTVTIDTTGGGTLANLYLDTTDTPTTTANTAYGIYNSLSEGANSLANTLYGIYTAVSNANNTSSGTRSIYGGYFTATGTTAGTNTAVGLYASAISADTNYAAIFENGNVGVGTTTPASPLHVVKEDGETAAITTLLTLTHSLSSQVTGEAGAGLKFQSENNVGAIKNSAEIAGVLSYTVNGNEQGALAFRTATAGTLAEKMRLDYAGALTPGVSNQSTLGSASLMWSDLFLASGGVINWNNGDVTATHSANTLAFAGASTAYTFVDSIVQAYSGLSIQNSQAYNTVSASTLALGNSNYASVDNNKTHGFYFSTTGTAASGASLHLIRQYNNGASATATSTSLTLDPSGYVGIGTTTPSYKLDIVGTGGNALLSLNAETTPTGYVIQKFINGGGTTYIGAEGSSSGGTFTNSLAYASIFSSGSTNPVQFGIGGAIKMTIDTSGNVGIGTTTPQTTLHVGGNVTLGINAVSSASPYLTFRTGFAPSASGGIGMISYDHSGDGNYDGLAVYGHDGISLWQEQAQVLTVKSGKVGIGTTTPQQKLSIESNNSTGWLYLTTTSGNEFIEAANGFYLRAASQNQIYMDGTATYLGNIGAAGDGSAARMTVLHSGNVGIGTTTPSQLLTVGNNNQFTVSSAGALVATTGTFSGQIHVSSLGTGSNSQLRLTRTNVGQKYFQIGGSQELIIYASDATTSLLTLSNAGALGVTAGLTATTGTFSGATTITAAGTPLIVTASDGGQSEVAYLKHSTSTVGALAGLIFNLKDSAASDISYGGLYTEIVANTADAASGKLIFYTRNAGTFSNTMTLSNAGALSISAGLTATTGTFSGVMGIGGSTDTKVALNLTGNILSGGGNLTGVFANFTGNSAGTTYLAGFQSYLSTQAAAYTVPDVYNFVSNDLQTKGAGSTVTNLYGFNAKTMSAGTNNYAFWTNQTAGDNNYAFYGSGTAKSYFAGNVGIGTTTPGYLLHMLKSSAAAAVVAMIENSGADGSASLRLKNDAQNWDLNTQTTDNFAIYDQTNSKQPFTIEPNTPSNTLYVDSAGYVGIGTTTPAALLTVGSSAPFKVDSSGQVIIYNDGVNWTRFNFTGNVNYIRGATYFDTASAYFTGGNIGIGTTTPQALLNISGTDPSIRIDGTGSEGIQFYRSLVQSWNITSLATSKNLAFYNNGGTNSYNLVIEHSTGNVGIGTTTPQTALSVVGTGTFTTIADVAEHTVCATVKGALTNCSSDIALKKNIVSISGEKDVLASLNQLRGVYFDWNTEVEAARDLGARRQVGMIAQEVEAVLPELVGTNSATGYKTLDYSKLTAFLIEALKAQQIEIEKLSSLILSTDNSSSSWFDVDEKFIAGPVLHIDEDGNIGIGVETPTAALDVKQTQTVDNGIGKAVFGLSSGVAEGDSPNYNVFQGKTQTNSGLSTSTVNQLALLPNMLYAVRAEIVQRSPDGSAGSYTLKGTFKTSIENREVLLLPIDENSTSSQPMLQTISAIKIDQVASTLETLFSDNGSLVPNFEVGTDGIVKINVQGDTTKTTTWHSTVFVSSLGN